VFEKIEKLLRRRSGRMGEGHGVRLTAILSPSGFIWLSSILLLSPAAAVAAVPAHTDTELQQWADDTLSRAIAQHRASGIAVAIVRDRKLMYLQGYGHSDRAGKILVDPNQTPFSIGSITKSFTATAVAQLLERGMIRSLDDPANKYLRRIQLPRKNDRDVTVRDLVTHRAGFDESTYDLATFETVPVPIAPKEILKRLPPIIRTPGEISVYSNIGYGVLGILIEDITGLTYGDYLRKNILVPLDMTHSYIRYRPQEEIAQPMEYSPNGEAAPIPQEWAYHPFISSSASLVSTAQDMAKFALGQLSAESGTVPALMNAATARLMHDRSIANAPSVAGFGMSFIANIWNGTRITENAGSGPGFQALFILLPDLNTGFVALIMGGGQQSLKMFAVREAFLNFYLGPLRPMQGPLAGEPMRHYAGIYRSERRPHSTSEAVLSPGTTLDVRAEGGDALTINGQQGYREIAAGTFWKPGVVPYVPNDASSDMYVFVPDANGKVKYVAPYLAVDVYMPASLDPMTVEIITIALCIACATGLLAFWWPVASTAGRLARLLAILLGAFAPAVPLVFAESLHIYGSPIFMIGFGHIFPLQIASALATGCAVFAILLAALWIRQGLRPERNPLTDSRIAKWHLASLSIAGIALTVLYAQYNLIGNHVP
jgi:CubicO group peptidase (beta-lactamase class C family)